MFCIYIIIVMSEATSQILISFFFCCNFCFLDPPGFVNSVTILKFIRPANWSFLLFSWSLKGGVSLFFWTPTVAQYGRRRACKPVWLSLIAINNQWLNWRLETELFTDDASSFESHYLLYELMNKTCDVKLTLDESLRCCVFRFGQWINIPGDLKFLSMFK